MKYIRVEFDPNYYGGDYDQVGQFVLIDADTENVEEAFTQETGHDSRHIIHYSPDELYDLDGDLIDDDTPMLFSTDSNNKIYPHLRNNKMIKENGGRLVAFKELSREAQLSMTHYMAVDGAAWCDEFEDWEWGEGTPYDSELRQQMLNDLNDFLPRFIERFGEVEFGVVNIPTQDLLNNIRKDAETSDDVYSTPETEGWEYETPTWPVILSGFHDETLQDGWTRFGRYLSLNAEKVTCLYYPK